MSTTVKDWYKIAKDWVLSNKEYVNTQYSTKGRSPSVQSDLVQEVTSFVLESELKEYNERVEQFDKYVETKKQEIEDLHKEMQNEIDHEKSIYEENMKSILDSHLDILKSEGKYLDKLKADMRGHMDDLGNMEKNVDENKEELINFVKNIKDVETDLKDRFADIVEKNKQIIETFFNAKKTELGDKLDGYYEPIKEELDDKKEKYTATLKQKFEERMSKVDKIVDEAYLKEQMAIKSKKKKALEAVTHINFELIIKYIILFAFTAIIVYVDFNMVKVILVDDNGGELLVSRMPEYQQILITIMIPTLFSLGIIVGEYLNMKILKSKFVTGIILFLIIFIVSLTVFRFDGFVPTLIHEPETNELVARILIFWVLIPANIYILYKYVHWYEILETITMIISLPIRLFAIPFNYIAYLIEMSALGKRKKSILEELDNKDAIMEGVNIELPSFSMDLDKISLDYDGDEEHNYSEIFAMADRFEKNLNEVSHTLKKIKDDIGDFNNDIVKSDQIINEKMFVLKQILTDFNARLTETIKNIEMKYAEPVASLKETIKSRSDQWSNYRKNFQQIEIAIKKGVLEGLNEMGK